MKKSKYTVEIDYSHHPGEKPITVTVKRGPEQVYEIYGSTLNSLLKQAMNAIAENES